MSKAKAGFWQCGLETGGVVQRPQVEKDNAILLSSGTHIHILAVDEIVEDGVADQKLRLADIAFAPEYEVDALRELQALSKTTVNIIKLSSRVDYLGRTPVKIKNIKTSDDVVHQSTWAEYILSKGLAVLLPESGQDISVLFHAENEAIKNGLGVWSDHTASAAYFVSANENQNGKKKDASLPRVADAIGRFVVVEGILKSIEHQKWRSYLNFGSDWRSDFTIALDDKIRQDFVGGDIFQDHLVDWIGRKMRVRGVVENRGGPYIALRNPDWLCVETD